MKACKLRLVEHKARIGPLKHSAVSVDLGRPHGLDYVVIEYENARGQADTMWIPKSQFAEFVRCCQKILAVLS